jgi:hypothetical protein
LLIVDEVEVGLAADFGARVVRRRAVDSRFGLALGLRGDFGRKAIVKPF